MAYPVFIARMLAASLVAMVMLLGGGNGVNEPSGPLGRPAAHHASPGK
jgi:hypothetical protein